MKDFPNTEKSRAQEVVLLHLDTLSQNFCKILDDLQQILNVFKAKNGQKH
jgi:hypothetical protein